jgi:hypothetical protein
VNTLTERAIQAAILSHFGRLFLLWRRNTGVGLTLDASRIIAFGLPGAADLEGILPGGQHLEIEVKSARGRQTDQQRKFQVAVESAGGLYILARSIAEVTAALEAAGYDPRGNPGNHGIPDHRGDSGAPPGLDTHAPPRKNPDPQEMDHPPAPDGN